MHILEYTLHQRKKERKKEGISIYMYEPPHDRTNKMACAPSEDRSAWASAQSDQSFRCPHEESLGPYLPTERTSKTNQTRRMPRLI